MNDANFRRGPAKFFNRLPAFVRPPLRWMIRGRVRKSLHAHGISRHTETEMTSMADRAWDALSHILGDRKYFMGDAPCGLDATAFAFIAGATSKTFESPVHDKARSLPNLIAYRDRMLAEFYPGFDAAGRPPDSTKTR
jgi:glutathione S-transferase